MNYTGRTLLAAAAALTLLGAGGGAAFADDTHGPDGSHAGDHDPGAMNPDGRDGVCTLIPSNDDDLVVDPDPDDPSVPLLMRDPDDPDCASEPGTPDPEPDPINACGSDVGDDDPDCDGSEDDDTCEPMGVVGILQLCSNDPSL